MGAPGRIAVSDERGYLVKNGEVGDACFQYIHPHYKTYKAKVFPSLGALFPQSGPVQDPVLTALLASAAGRGGNNLQTFDNFHPKMAQIKVIIWP
jgi:hypothetical protein